MAQRDEIGKQQNSIVQKNKHLEDAYRIIEDYINKITDSIRYAEQIQKAILPPMEVVEVIFYRIRSFITDRRILFPGDFYWFGKRRPNTFFCWLLIVRVMVFPVPL